MQKVIKLIIIFTLCVLSFKVRAQNDSSGFSKVYFICNFGNTPGIDNYNIFIDSTFKCKLNERRYSIHEVQSGIHNFSIRFAGKRKPKRNIEKTIINIASGKIYYILLMKRFDTFLTYIYCQEITENTANTIISQLELDKSCGSVKQ